jgi:hypothetical protein
MNLECVHVSHIQYSQGSQTHGCKLAPDASHRKDQPMLQPKTAKIALFVFVVLTIGVLIGRFLPL